MGWVIGLAPVHGDGILISDTSVVFTLTEKETLAYCLQKIHYVGPNILSAFTGSAKIGFRMVAEMKKQLGTASLDRGWNIDEISGGWIPRLLKRIYENSEEDEKGLGSQIIFVAAHPHKVHGGSSLPWIDTIKFCSPEFEPEKGFMNRPLLIGTQAKHEIAAVREVCKQQFSIHMVVEDQHEQAAAIANIMGNYASENSSNGTRPRFQVGLIARGKSVIVDSPELNSPVNVSKSQSPDIVDTYGSFIKFCAERHLEPSCALA